MQPTGRSNVSRSRRLWAAATSLLVPAMSVGLSTGGPVLAAEGHHQLPDLVAQRPDYVDISLTYAPTLGSIYLEGPREPFVMRLRAAAINQGDVAVDLLGVPTTEPLALDAHQCVIWNGPVCAERVVAGRMRWHDAHRHWHFDDFALYELRRLDAAQQPDMSSPGLVGEARKASFCLEDSAQVSENAFPVGFYRGCGGVSQGISPGWSDVYDASLPGQQLSLEHVTDGRYALVITVDPLDRLRESDESNNQSWAVVEVTNGVTSAQVVLDP